MASNVATFETMAAGLIVPVCDPPQHAALFCIDENTAIQYSTS
jgi:hypothetical protein